MPDRATTAALNTSSDPTTFQPSVAYFETQTASTQLLGSLHRFEARGYRDADGTLHRELFRPEMKRSLHGNVTTRGIENDANGSSAVAAGHRLDRRLIDSAGACLAQAPFARRALPAELGRALA